MVYLDHAATSPLRAEVLAVLERALREEGGNPSSLHRIGLRAEAALREARERIARALQCEPGEIVFTSGGTESNNLAIQGFARERRRQGRHLVTCQVEHSSVMEVFRALEREGFEVDYLPVGPDGRVDPGAVARAIREDTVLVSIQRVNNEVGALQPVEAIARHLATLPRPPRLHVDAVQALGRVPLPLKAWGVDAASFSAHKVGGPKGVGVLYLRKGVPLEPLMYGGGQEAGLRPGTENVPGIVAMAEAIDLAVREQPQVAARMRQLQNYLVAKIREAVPGAQLLGPAEEGHRAPHIIALAFPGFRGEVVLHALEARDVYVSTGSACSSKRARGSRVLQAMGVPETVREGMVRLSLGPGHTEKDMDVAAAAFADAVAELAPFAATRPGPAGGGRRPAGTPGAP